MTLHPTRLRLHSKAYSEDREHSADTQCRAWNSYDIAPKKTNTRRFTEEKQPNGR